MQHTDSRVTFHVRAGGLVNKVSEASASRLPSSRYHSCEEPEVEVAVREDWDSREEGQEALDALEEPSMGYTHLAGASRRMASEKAGGDPAEARGVADGRCRYADEDQEAEDHYATLIREQGVGVGVGTVVPKEAHP